MNEIQAAPVHIPLEALSSETLSSIIQSFVEREGTDYGSVEISYETKQQQVRRQLEKGDAVLVFDPNTESVQIMDKISFKKIAQNFE